MPSPIIQNMLNTHGYTQITEENYLEFINAHTQVVLFFAEDPKRYPESDDVAMVLPEILKEYSDMQGAIVSQEFEHALQKRFDFTRWPALAFFSQGQYRGAITGIQNWEDYLQQIPALLSDNNIAIPALNV